ncbi:hypothetical protein HK096_003602 [Nowakowskiella sp. JEL0078]|nr:hypothetical protein HK096_003602 [Nowakowskiella sp. JEL0078]
MSEKNNSTKRSTRLGSLKPSRFQNTAEETSPKEEEPEIENPFGEIDDILAPLEFEEEDFEMNEYEESVQSEQKDKGKGKPKFQPKIPQSRATRSSTVDSDAEKRVELDERGRIKSDKGRGRGRGRGQLEFRAADGVFGLGPLASAGRGAPRYTSGGVSGGGGSIYLSKSASRGFHGDLQDFIDDEEEIDDLGFEAGDALAPVRIGRTKKSVEMKKSTHFGDKSFTKMEKKSVKSEHENEPGFVPMEVDSSVEYEKFDKPQNIFEIDEESDEKHYAFFTLPSVLPKFAGRDEPVTAQKKPATRVRQDPDENKPKPNPFKFNAPPSPSLSALPFKDGKIGKMKVYKDGRTMLKIGNIWFDVRLFFTVEEADDN